MQASPLDVPKAAWRQDEEIEIFSDAVGQFFEKECVPHAPQWRKDGIVPLEIWKKAGEMGLLGASIPEEYGGAGGDFRPEAINLAQQQWKGADAQQRAPARVAGAARRAPEHALAPCGLRGGEGAPAVEPAGRVAVDRGPARAARK